MNRMNFCELCSEDVSHFDYLGGKGAVFPPIIDCIITITFTQSSLQLQEGIQLLNSVKYNLASLMALFQKIPDPFLYSHKDTVLTTLKHKDVQLLTMTMCFKTNTSLFPYSLYLLVYTVWRARLIREGTPNNCEEWVI